MKDLKIDGTLKFFILTGTESRILNTVGGVNILPQLSFYVILFLMLGEVESDLLSSLRALVSGIKLS